MGIKVLIAFSNTLFSEGVKMLLEDGSEDFRVEDILRVGGSPYEMFEVFKPDVILVDLITLYNQFVESGPKREMRFILFDSGCGPANIASAITDKGLKGVLTGNTATPTLKEAIRAVAEGREWFDHASFIDFPAIKIHCSGDNASERAK